MVKAQNLWVKHKETPKYSVSDLVWLDGHNLQTEQPTVLRHGRDVLPTWDKLTYWEHGKESGSGFYR